MTFNSKKDVLSGQIDYLVAHLLDFFRDPKNEARFIHAAQIALNQLGRSALKPALLKKRFMFLAYALKNNLSPHSIRDFANACLDAAGLVGPREAPNHSAEPSRSELNKKAQIEIQKSITDGHLPDAALNRAAYQLLKRKKAQESSHRISHLLSSHPLKEALGTLPQNPKNLAREDIRHHFLYLRRDAHPKAAASGMLFSLLKRAEAFSTVRLHRLLGDELFFLCRPLGFLEQNASILVIEVPSSAHLHALTYRKLDILLALKKDPVFASAKSIKLKIA